MPAEVSSVKRTSNIRSLYSLLLDQKFEKLEFFISHKSGPHHRFCLQALPDGSCLVQFAGSTYCRVPQFDEFFINSDHESRYGGLRFLDRTRWRRLSRLLDGCDVLDWDVWLSAGNLEEGTHWYLDISSRDSRRICRGGCDAFPPPWEKFISLLQREIDQRIR